FRRRSVDGAKVRRPRAGFVTPHSGGSGTPPYGHYEPCARSSLNGLRKSRKCLIRSHASAARGLVGRVDFPKERRQWSAGRRAASPSTRPRRTRKVRPLIEERRPALHSP